MSGTKKKIMRRVEAKVSKTDKNGATTEEISNLGEKIFETPPLNVGMSGGFTKNLGDYQSAKVQVSLHVPCEIKELEDTYDFVRTWVDDKVAELWDDIEVQPAKQTKRRS